MAVCDYCSKRFGLFGVHENGYSFCSAACRDRTRQLLQSLDAVAPQEIQSYVDHARAGPCKGCGGSGPVDLYQSYRVYSFVVLTRWSTQNHFVCRSCAPKEQIKSLALSALFGWWGIPFGLIFTPVQIVRNIAALAGKAGGHASQRLQNILKLNLARQIAARAATMAGPTIQAAS
ncbi:MAG TPA: hypothetical protein VMF12_03910 [Xanthobacteraceae bacterium]|nr:hypothetical protein [Xanthobacteraceae bacterium]